MEEHVESIKSQVRVLNAGGLILHSFWHGQGEEFYDGLRFHYYDETTIEALYEPYFEILTICNYREEDTDDSIYLIGKKKSL